jgi:hypothetical protein
MQTPTTLVKSKNVLVLLLGIMTILSLGLAGFFGYKYWQSQLKPVTSYEECVKANGNQTTFMFPGTCTTRDGRQFTQPLTEEEKKKLQLSADPTANWETYISENYSFSFKYPSQWVIRSVSAPNLDDQIWIASSHNRIPPGKYGEVGNDARSPISIVISKQDLSLNYKKEQFNNFQSNSYIIDNIVGVKKSGYSKEGLSQETIISVKMGDWYLNIIPLGDEESQQLDQILSTIRFTN